MFDLTIFGDRFWLWTGASLYTLGFIFALVFLARAKAHSRPVLFGIIAAGFIAQTIGLYLRGLETGRCPIGNTFEIMQFVVWSLILIYMSVGPAFRMSLLGFFSAGLASIIGLLSLSVQQWDGPRHLTGLGENPWIDLHASLAIFSYGIFAILALISAMYLIQTYSLKKKMVKGISPFLPSIMQLDQMVRRLLFAGVAILTIALGIGFVYLVREPEAGNWLKISLTFAIWAGYLVLASLRCGGKVAAQTMAWTCIILFAVALASIWPIAGLYLEAPAMLLSLLSCGYGAI